MAHYLHLNPVRAKIVPVERLQSLASAAKIALERLPKACSARERVLLAAAMKRVSSVSNGWLAERMAMGQPASVSQFVRRFHLAGHSSEPAYLRLLSRVKS